MKKYQVFYVLLIAVLFSAVSCGGLLGSIEVQKENPKSPKLSQYKNIHVGWFDLGVGNWKDLGYDSKKEWKAVIKAFNLGTSTSGLHTYFRRGNHLSLMGKTITGAKSSNKNRPPEEGLHLKFSNPKIDKGTPMITPLNLTFKVEYYDIQSNKKIYEASVKVYARKMPGGVSIKGGMSITTFEGKLDRLAYWVSKSVADNF